VARSLILACLLLVSCSDDITIVGSGPVPTDLELRYYDVRWAEDMGDGFWVAYSYGHLINTGDRAITVTPGLELRYDTIEGETFQTAYGVTGNVFLSIPPFEGLEDTVTVLNPGEGADFSVVTIPFQRNDRNIYGYSIFQVEVR